MKSGLLQLPIIRLRKHKRIHFHFHLHYNVDNACTLHTRFNVLLDVTFKTKSHMLLQTTIYLSILKITASNFQERILRDGTLQGQPNNITIRYFLSYPGPYLYIHTDFSKSIYKLIYYQTHTYIYKHILRIEHFTSENLMIKYKHIHSFNINITSRYNLQF